MKGEEAGKEVLRNNCVARSVNCPRMVGKKWGVAKQVKQDPVQQTLGPGELDCILGADVGISM